MMCVITRHSDTLSMYYPIGRSLEIFPQRHFRRSLGYTFGSSGSQAALKTPMKELQRLKCSQVQGAANGTSRQLLLENLDEQIIKKEESNKVVFFFMPACQVLIVLDHVEARFIFFKVVVNLGDLSTIKFHPPSGADWSYRTSGL